MLLVLFLLVLASSSAYAGASDLSGEIIVWGWPAADQAFEAILDGFHRKYPNIKVKIEMMPNADQHTKLLTSLAAGAGAPDVAMIESPWIGQFAARGGLADLLQPPFNAGRYKDDVIPYKWSQATTPDGRLIAIPWDIGPATMFYRADIFQEVGLPFEPEDVRNHIDTWEAYIEAGKKVTIPNKRFMYTDAAVIFSLYFNQHNYFTKDTYELAINTPENLYMLQVCQQVRQAGIDANVAQWGPEWQAMLGNGSIVTELLGCWFGGFLKSWIAPDTAGKWRIAPIPGKLGVNWGGSFLAIPEQSKNKELAWAFVEYALLTAEAQNAMFKAVDYFPSYIPAFDDPMYSEPDPWFGGQRTRLLWIEVANATPDVVVTPLDRQVADILGAEITRIIDQNLDPETSLQQVEEKIMRDIRRDYTRFIRSLQ